MKTPLTYYGGKQRMLPHILPLIPDHDTYVEPFAGGAAVFWAKSPSPIEVRNDTNRELMTFYAVLTRRPRDLAELISASLHSRRLYDFSGLVYQFPEFFDEVRLAWAVWMQCQQSFCASIGNAWGYGRQPSPNGTDATTRKLAAKRAAFTEPTQLQAMANRLGHVQLECTDAVRVIQSRDTPRAFHYVDPPYPGSMQGHYAGYGEADFARLLDALAQVKGKFLLSCYGVPSLLAAAEQHGWHIRTVSQAISASLVSSSKGERRAIKVEYLVANYPLP
jgi:DNA adenine methylase